MEKMKLILLKLPEFYLIVLATLSCYTPPFSFNPIVIGLVAIAFLQIVFKNKITGLIIAGILLLINLFMFFALISELKEFTTSNSDTIQLLFGGLLFLGLNLFMAAIMVYKYSIKGDINNIQIQASPNISDTI